MELRYKKRQHHSEMLAALEQKKMIFNHYSIFSRHSEIQERIFE